MRITCDRCRKDRMLNEVHTPARRATPAPRPQTGMALHTLDGARKYLTTAERDAFLRAAEQVDRPPQRRLPRRAGAARAARGARPGAWHP